jgi:hypothetical protein
LPYFLCTFPLTSTGTWAHIQQRAGISPKSFLLCGLGCKEGPLWHSHNPNGYDSRPCRF